MSLHRSCCCGEPSDCSATCCNTSYTVAPFNLPYTFERTVTGTSCGQGYCYRRSYTIALNVIHGGGTVLTRTVLAGGASCCYRGTTTLQVTGTVTIEEVFEAGNNLCPPPDNLGKTVVHTYNFDRDVCACFTVTCSNKIDACNYTHAPGLQHTLEVGDFVIVCDHEGFTADCDTCPTPYGPWQLRSVGARFAWSSDVGCLTALANKKCLGWWPPADQACGPVGEYGLCYANLQTNVASAGPFGIVQQEECDQGRIDNCTDDSFGGVFLPTIFTGEPPAISNLLQSPCPNVDTDYNPCPTINIAIRQQGGCPFSWAYL